MELSQWIADLGLPVGLIAFGAYCVSRSARFFAPLISRITEKHIELIDTLKLQSEQQTNIMRSQNQVLTQHGELLNQIHHVVHEKPRP